MSSEYLDMSKLTCSTNTILNIPKPIWKWDLFGDKWSLQLMLTKDVSWWKRFWTKVFFGSKWERLGE